MSQNLKIIWNLKCFWPHTYQIILAWPHCPSLHNRSSSTIRCPLSSSKTIHHGIKYKIQNIIYINYLFWTCASVMIFCSGGISFPQLKENSCNELDPGIWWPVFLAFLALPSEVPLFSWILPPRTILMWGFAGPKIFLLCYNIWMAVWLALRRQVPCSHQYLTNISSLSESIFLLWGSSLP